MRHYKHGSHSLYKQVAFALIALILSSCANIQTSDNAQEEQSNPLLQQAQDALSQQRYSVAAQLFEQLSTSSSDPSTQNQHLISAAEAFMNAGDLTNTDKIITTLLGRSSTLSNVDKLKLAKMLLQQGKADDTTRLLMGLNESELSNEQRITLHTLSSSAFFQAGNLIESARERVLLDSLISQTDEKRSNQIKLLEALSLLSQQALDFLRPTADNNMAGWIDLAIILKQQATFDANSLSANIWKEQYPLHPANGEFLSAIAQQTQENFKAPNKVGIFLPSKGAFAQIAHSIRKGILSSAYEMANQWPINVSFYDTSSSSIDSLYQQAISDGVDVIIGPLDKANTAKITALNELAIPVIALNKNGTHHSNNYYEFSLSPEEEVTQTLSLAWLKGHQKALILTPQSRYGERLASHFSDVWQQLGGKILDIQTYPLKQADYSNPIKHLLQIDDSISRFKKLRQRLNLNIKFEERRRHDADFIFLLAAPREGRLIKPQLRFHRAADVEVFSTPKIYEGALNKVANRDLDDIFFCDMPWLIGTTNPQDQSSNEALSSWSKTRGGQRRLMAFGYDAYQLIPHLERMKSNDYARHKGKTGILSLNENGLVSRQLSCGYFKHGAIKSLGLAPHLERALMMPPANAIETNINSQTKPL
jgi:outer membrane PBP1 activator LpoA protein